MQMGNYINETDKKDATPYIEHLKDIDAKNGGKTVVYYDLMLSNAKMYSKAAVNELIDVRKYI